jgi:hypothetical protein
MNLLLPRWDHGNIIIIIIIIIIISSSSSSSSITGIQPLGRSGQRPELSQAAGMALVRCILDKFLGVVCHCFPPCLDVPTFATRCPHVRHDARELSGGRWDFRRECCPVILPKWRLPCHLGIFYMPQIYDMGPTALLPLRRKAWWGFFRPSASAGFEPANLGTKGQHATPRPPKPLQKHYMTQIVLWTAFTPQALRHSIAALLTSYQ